MEFFFAVFFLLFYYLRPQDWVPGLVGANLIKPIIAAWLVVLVTNRSKASPMPGLLRTPHDWIILIYWGYVVYTAPDASAALTGFLPLVAFYALTVQSVNSWDRLLRYLSWWNIALVIVAALALLSLIGIDLTGAKDVTARFADRLSLGTWLHNNPNSLGHSIVVVIPVSYFLFFWRKGAASRLFLFPLLAGVAYYCVYKTESKGAFLVGGILVALIFVVGRPKFVQSLAIITAVTLGVSALSFLPRMAQMSNLRADEGVQGRLMAWEIARGVTRKSATGEGWMQFQAFINWKEGNRMIYDIPKATHASYVQVGADLGKYGLLIYLAGLWTAIHTLMRFRPASEIEDRCRRILIVLIAANLISGWMINRQYHTEYFLLIAATASLHRLRKGTELSLAAESRESKSAEQEAETSETDEITPPESERGHAPPASQAAPAFSTKVVSSFKNLKPLWNRLGVVDVAVCAALTWLTFWTWDYILQNL